jgi:hypothetical protein
MLRSFCTETASLLLKSKAKVVLPCGKSEQRMFWNNWTRNRLQYSSVPWLNIYFLAICRNIFPVCAYCCLDTSDHWLVPILRYSIYISNRHILIEYRNTIFWSVKISFNRFSPNFLMAYFITLWESGGKLVVLLIVTAVKASNLTCCARHYFPLFSFPFSL